MKIKDIITENKYTLGQKDAAGKELAGIYVNDVPLTPEIMRKAKKLAAISGKNNVIYYVDPIEKNKYRRFRVGDLLQSLHINYLAQSKESGKLPPFSASGLTTKSFAETIAAHTNGKYRVIPGVTWTTGLGQRYRDAEDHIVYQTDEDLESAWEFLGSKGKKVYYREGDNLITAIKIGKFIVEKATRIKDAFGDSPITTYMLSVRSASVINKAHRTQAEISDQEAHRLTDIAASRDRDSMEAIRRMFQWLQSKKDADAALKAITDSPKIEPEVKDIIDKIVADAQNFKEDDQ